MAPQTAMFPIVLRNFLHEKAIMPLSSTCSSGLCPPPPESSSGSDLGWTSCRIRNLLHVSPRLGAKTNYRNKSSQMAGKCCFEIGFANSEFYKKNIPLIFEAEFIKRVV